MQKVANEIRVGKQTGFIQHLIAAGKTPEQIKSAHAKYVELDKRREARVQANFEGISKAILDPVTA